MTTAPIHLLKIIRGFEIEGPTNLVLGLLQSWQRAEICVTLVSLSAGGGHRAALEKEIARLGGSVHIFPTAWRDVKRTSAKVRGLDVFPTVTHLGAHLLRPDAVARHLARETGLPYLLTEHGLHGLREGPPLTAGPAMRWYRATFPANAIAGGISPKVCRELRSHLPPGARVELLQNGIDLDFFRPASPAERIASREKLAIPADAFPVLATVGSLSARKDPALAVEILHELVQRKKLRPHLVLCGEGPLRLELESRLHHANLMKHATMTRHTPDPRPVYAAANILVHPALDEPFGLVVAEAVACGLPVITRAGSGADEIAPGWPLATSVDGRNPFVWADSMMSLLGEIGCWESGQEKTNAARDYAEQNYAIRITAARYLTVLNSMNVVGLL